MITWGIQTVFLWYPTSIRLHHNIQLQTCLDNVLKFASEPKVNMENFNSAVIPPEHMLLNAIVNAPLHLYSSTLEEKNQHWWTKCWNIFVFYATTNWTTMEGVLKIWQNYTLMRTFSVLICTDWPIILFNSKNHKEYIGKKLQDNIKRCNMLWFPYKNAKNWQTTL